MQLLFDESDEGTLPGLSWIPGVVRRLPAQTAVGEVRLPHKGWSPLEMVAPHDLFDMLADDARYYFVHGYAVVPTDPAHVIALAGYGDPFVAVVGRDNIVGTQFHPEKSHRHGKALLAGFLHNVDCPVGGS
jgi:glutamine amidotransferase